MTLRDFFYIIVASQGFLLSLLLFLKKNKEIHLPLIVFLCLSSIDFAFQFLYASRIILSYPHLIYVTEPLTILRGVLIFMYVRNIYHDRPVFYKKDVLFLIPFVTYTVYYVDFYTTSASQKLKEYTAFLQEGMAMTENLVEWAFELLVSFPFVVASIVLLRKLDFQVKNEYSDIENFNYSMARKLLLGVLIVYIFEFLTIILSYFGFKYAEISNSISYFTAATLLYLLGYDALVRHNNITALKHPDTGTEEPVLPLPEMPTDTTKYKKNILSAEQSEAIAGKLRHSMETEKLYRNADIRLTTLAEALEENPNYVSQVINQLFGQNFYDFVNTYRINEAKMLLKSSQYNQLTIEAVGYDVGFKSKSTFYTAFKKMTTLTPVEFKNGYVVE